MTDGKPEEPKKPGKSGRTIEGPGFWRSFLPPELPDRNRLVRLELWIAAFSVLLAFLKAGGNMAASPFPGDVLDVFLILNFGGFFLGWLVLKAKWFGPSSQVSALDKLFGLLIGWQALKDSPLQAPTPPETLYRAYRFGIVVCFLLLFVFRLYA